jgi:hypothetical protein
MPIGEIEQHPYLNYLIQFSNELNINVNIQNINEKIIIGTFPVYGCTDTIDNNGNIIASRNSERLRFFYGSNRSIFWDIFFQVFESDLPITRGNAMSLLLNNNFLISDVLERTSRLNESASDKDLRFSNDCLNLRLINMINDNKNLKYIYFTSTQENDNSPYSIFKQIFNINDGNEYERFVIDTRLWSLKLNIDNRKFNVFFLPTPKTRGIHFNDKHKLEMFCNYLKSKDSTFFNEIIYLKKNKRSQEQEQKLSIYRKDFLFEAYKQSLVLCNMKFDGTIN